MILTPFARTQSKTIAQQYAAGCRSFDIRIRRTRNGWKCAHGLWLSRRDVLDVIYEIDRFPERCEVSITYEGKITSTRLLQEFIEYVVMLQRVFFFITYGPTCVKYGNKAKGIKVSYETILQPQDGYVGGVEDFLGLNGRRWQSFLPIPRLWHHFYKRKYPYNEKTFVFVDFL